MRTARRRLTLPVLPELLPLAGVVAFAATLAWTFARIANALAWNSDLVSPMVMADTVATVPGPHDVAFGTYAPYSSLWFDVITRPLPFHRELWETAPLVFSLVAVGLLAWVSWRLAGRWAAVVTLAVGLAWSGPVLVTMVAQADHGTAYFVVCLLASFLVLVAAHPRSRWTTVAAVAVVGAVAGVNVASDPLLLLVGIGPLVGAPLVVAVRGWTPTSRRVLAVAGGAGALAVVVAVVTAQVMDAAGYRVLGLTMTAGSPLALASPSDMVGNAGRLVENLLRVWSADFLDEGLGFTTVFRVLLAGPALAVVAVPILLLVRAIRRPTAPSPAAPGTDGDAGPAPAPAERLYLLFWGLVVTGLLAGSIVSRLAVDNADRAVGYLTPVVLAVAATLPFAVVRTRIRWARLATGVGVALLCVISAVDLTRAAKGDTERPFVVDGPAVLSTLQRLGLTRGYAAYASASGFTYQSDGRITVRPVFPCLVGPDRPSLCGFFANRIASWYVPKPGVRTFLIADPTLPAGIPVPPPPEFGTPDETVTVGSQTIYVYPYDVATRFGPTF